MLKQLIQHRWICFVQGGLTLLLSIGLISLRPLIEDRLMGTFVTVVVLLSTGFVLVAAGLLDLVVAVEVTARQRRMHTVLVWWLPGLIGLGVGLTVLLAPSITMRLLAVVAAFHALLVTALDLAMLPSFSRHPLPRNLLLVSAFLCITFGVLLVVGALGTEAMAIRAVGFYALYFGLRLMFMGSQLATGHHAAVAVS
ncbi:MAG TPA: hypothetical protein VM554_12020 [Acidisarcina sp.]|nr:hypothetical protein [Acidisarcina sp.]